MDKLNDELKDYTKAIELNHNDTKAYYNRGFVKYYLEGL